MSKREQGGKEKGQLTKEGRGKRNARKWRGKMNKSNAKFNKKNLEGVAREEVEKTKREEKEVDKKEVDDVPTFLDILLGRREENRPFFSENKDFLGNPLDYAGEEWFSSNLEGLEWHFFEFYKENRIKSLPVYLTKGIANLPFPRSGPIYFERDYFICDGCRGYFLGNYPFKVDCKRCKYFDYQFSACSLECLVIHQSDQTACHNFEPIPLSSPLSLDIEIPQFTLEVLFPLLSWFCFFEFCAGYIDVPNKEKGKGKGNIA